MPLSEKLKLIMHFEMLNLFTPDIHIKAINGYASDWIIPGCSLVWVPILMESGQNQKFQQILGYLYEKKFSDLNCLIFSLSNNL